MKPGLGRGLDSLLKVYDEEVIENESLRFPYFVYTLNS